MSVSTLLFETDKHYEVYAVLREWLKARPDYMEFVEQDEEMCKRLLSQFVQLVQRRSDLSYVDVSTLAFGAIDLLEDGFSKAKPQFQEHWPMIYRDFYAAKWKMTDLQGMVKTNMAERLSGRAQCLWSLGIYHYLAEGTLRHLMLALWLALEIGSKGKRLNRYSKFEEQDPAELISLFIDKFNWASLLNSLYERDLRIAFAHVQYQMGKELHTISLTVNGENVEFDHSALAERVLRLFDATTSLGFGVEAFFLRNHESFDIASLGLQIDHAQYLSQIQTTMVIRGFRLQLELRKDVSAGLEILAKLSPIGKDFDKSYIEKFAKDNLAEIVIYLDHYTSFQAENIRLTLTTSDDQAFKECLLGPEKLKNARKSAGISK